MAWEDVWAVLKWVLAVLAAGFIGQFGRVLAMRIIERRRNALEGEEPRGGDTPSLDPREKKDLQATAEAEAIKATAKIEKKRAKAAVKAAKKNANDESSKSPR